MPTTLFLLWNPQLFRGEAGLPKRTYFLFACAVLLSILWFMRGWSFGVKYQGPQFTYTVCIVNGLWASLLAVLFIGSFLLGLDGLPSPFWVNCLSETSYRFNIADASTPD